MQFGILVKNLYDSELNWRLLSQANHLMQSQIADIVFFYEDAMPQVVHPLGTCMQIVEAYEYKYPLIATNLSTAQKLINFPRSPKKIFYMWDMEWLRFKNDSYYGFKNIYGSKELELVCRTQEHADLVEKLWDRKINRVSPKALLNEILNEVKDGS